MSLIPGTRIGPFEITGVLGAGAMGEVYRARDPRLGREAALKLLPETFAADPDRVARFNREAQVLASLSHPNIGGIYGLEESTATKPPVRALVLELIEGETLSERIAPGPIPVSDALSMIRQIAEALQAAHDQNVIHRDLKPANIKITPDGVVKVLDFGLAKLSGRNDAGASAPDAGSPGSLQAFAATDPSDAVTMMGPGETNTGMTTDVATSAGATLAGALVGTIAYMSPEQAKGRPVDKRSDVWALGCIMYEMLTGRHPFRGEDVTQTITAVIRSEPDWTKLPAELPPPVARVLRQCLEKDRRKRVGDAAAVLFSLDQANLPGEIPVKRGPTSRQLIAAGAALFVVAALVAGFAVWVLTRPEPGPITRLAIAPDADQAFSTKTGAQELAISPDGKRIVYVGDEGRLIVRDLDSLESTVIGDLEGPQAPFFFTDGQTIAYTRRNSDLRTVSAAGGPSKRLVQLDSTATGGGTYAEDGRIVYATTSRVTGLLELTPGASTPNVLTTPDRARGEADHLWPEFLPGGRAVLFTITQMNGQPGTGQIAVYDFQTKTTSVVLSPGADAHYTPTGHLVYSSSGALRAIKFDPRTYETSGEPLTVVPSVQTKELGAANFDISGNGTLVYAPGGVSESSTRRELVWVSRDGSVEPVGAPFRTYQYPRLSPDGFRVVLDIRDQDNDLWIWDFRTRALTRLTDTPALDRYPVWTPDGKHVVFVSDETHAARRCWPAIWSIRR